MATTLAEVLSDDRVEFDELHRRYQPVLGLVDILIGVVPNCDRYLEIWPPGFRTYNLMVPNFLNLPASLIGMGAPKDSVGLAMYMSSRAASCAYCSAHCCSFALRRGSSADAVTGETRTAAEAAVVAVAEALSTMPHHYTPELGRQLQQHFSAEDAEWIVMSVIMMGFLNKFMDGVGVELEQEAINDVAELIEPTGWAVGQHGWSSEEAAKETETDGGAPSKDSLGTMLRVAGKAPGAIKLEKQWMQGIPKDPERIRQYINDTYAYDEPLLTMMAHGKPRRALGAMLRHNLDPEQSELGIGLKALVGLVYANHANNKHLIDRARTLADHYGVDPELVKAVDTFDPGSADDGLDVRTRAALTAAHAMAPSPAVVDQAAVDTIAASLSSAEIVETAVWVSVNQLVHRLSVFFEQAD